MISGAFAGFLLGSGLLLVWWSCWHDEHTRQRHPLWERWSTRLEIDLTRAGLGMVPPAAVPALCAGFGLFIAVAVWVPGQAWVPALILGVLSAAAPLAALRAASAKHAAAMREVWPEAVDYLCSAIRAGMSLPEALIQLSERGPEPLREPFAQFAADYRSNGDFGASLTRLKARLADPVADRIVEALRLTRDVGGNDLGVLLRTLGSFLREDARTRAELEARQSWTINAARLALVAPWIVVALMATRPVAAAAYNTATGAAVMVTGAVVSLFAYQLMMRIARLPQEERVLQ